MEITSTSYKIITFLKLELLWFNIDFQCDFRENTRAVSAQKPSRLVRFDIVREDLVIFSPPVSCDSQLPSGVEHASVMAV